VDVGARRGGTRVAEGRTHHAGEGAVSVSLSIVTERSLGLLGLHGDGTPESEPLQGSVRHNRLWTNRGESKRLKRRDPKIDTDRDRSAAPSTKLTKARDRSCS